LEFSLSLEEIDQMISIHQGSCDTPVIACDTPFINQPLLANETYFIRVGSYEPTYQGGAFIFNAALPNDQCQNAEEVVGSVIIDDTRLALSEPDEDDIIGCDSPTPGNKRDLWYVYTPAEEGTLNLCFDFEEIEHTVSVHLGGCEGPVLACDTSTISQNVFSGIDYYLRIGTFDPDASGGAFVLDLELFPEVPIDPSDLCPDDPLKEDPGVCGCGIPDEDNNGDGFFDCVGSLDLCPDDDNKILPGICGCGVEEVDLDSDGLPDCLHDMLDLGGIFCWDLNENGIGDLDTEDTNGDLVVDVLDCQGPAGSQGPAGPQGPAGSSGSAGSDGQTGSDGISCWDLNGNGLAQLDSEDINGDGQVSVADCQGLAGNDGKDGTDGIACWDLNGNGLSEPYTEDINHDGLVDVLDCHGSDGHPGPAGKQGTTGPQGPQGSEGSQGPTGFQGEQGPQGPAGPQGPIGQSGPVDDIASAGVCGVGGSTTLMLLLTMCLMKNGWSRKLRKHKKYQHTDVDQH